MNGGRGGNGGSGGSGGGAFEIQATGTLTVEGELSAIGGSGQSRISGQTGESNNSRRIGSGGTSGTVRGDAGNGGAGGRGGDGGFGGVGGTGGPGAGGAGGTIRLRGDRVLFTGAGQSFQTNVSGGVPGLGTGGQSGQDGQVLLVVDRDSVGQGVLNATFLANLGRAVVDDGIDFIGDEDWYRFAISSARTLTAISSGPTDVVATLYDRDGSTVLAENDDQIPSNTNFYLSYHLQPGTYFLSIRGFGSNVGDYEASIEIAEGITPPNLFTFEENGVSQLQWEVREGLETRLLNSDDLIRWNYYEPSISYSRGGLQTRNFPAIQQGQEFFRIVESVGKGAFATRVSSSSDVSGSAAVFGATGGFTFSAGNPANFGDTILSLDGEGLSQSTSVTMASVGGVDSRWRMLARTPGDLTESFAAPLDETYLAVNNSNGSEISGANFSLVNFPYGSGWIGGHVGRLGQILDASHSSGISITERTPGAYTVNLSALGATTSQGALFVTGADNEDLRMVSTAALSTSWAVGVFDSNGTFDDDSLLASSWSFVYVPYSTQGIVLGGVGANAPSGGGGFTSRYDGPTQTWRLSLPSVSNLSGGALLVTSVQSAFSTSSVRPIHLQWRIIGSEIAVYAHDLPLTSESLTQDSSFVFAFFPFDRLIAEPGL